MGGRKLIRRVRADESGFTMIELLTTMIVAIVVILALFTFQDVVLRQSNRVFATVNATQRARTAVETLETRLRSACVAEGVTPILAGSTGTSLAFISKFGSAASLTPEKHVVSLSGGTMTDSVYPVSGGQAPNWTFSNTATSTRLLVDHVTQLGSTPIFRYYKYGIAADSAGGQYKDGAGNPFMILLDGTATLPTGTTTSTGGAVAANTIPYNSANDRSMLATPLSTADSKLTSAVAVTMVVDAEGKLGDTVSTDAYTQLTVQDTVVLRLTPVPSEGNLPTVPPCA